MRCHAVLKKLRFSGLMVLNYKTSFVNFLLVKNFLITNILSLKKNHHKKKLLSQILLAHFFSVTFIFFFRIFFCHNCFVKILTNLAVWADLVKESPVRLCVWECVCGSYYSHRSGDSLSPVCGNFLSCCHVRLCVCVCLFVCLCNREKSTSRRVEKNLVKGRIANFYLR